MKSLSQPRIVTLKSEKAGYPYLLDCVSLTHHPCNSASTALTMSLVSAPVSTRERVWGIIGGDPGLQIETRRSELLAQIAMTLQAKSCPLTGEFLEDSEHMQRQYICNTYKQRRAEGQIVTP